MPDTISHLRQANHNQQFLNSLDLSKTPFLDWIITIAFYTSLHFIEAWLGTKNIHINNHKDRDTWIMKSKELKHTVWPYYKDLEFHSEQARYMCRTFDRKFVQETIVLEYLGGISSKIKSLGNFT